MDSHLSTIGYTIILSGKNDKPVSASGHGQLGVSMTFQAAKRLVSRTSEAMYSSMMSSRSRAECSRNRYS